MQKQLEGTRSILMSSADRVAHIDGQLSHNINEAIHALPAGIMPKVIKQNIHLRMFAGFSVLTTFSAPPQILAASNSFCPIPETKK